MILRKLITKCLFWSSPNWLIHNFFTDLAAQKGQIPHSNRKSEAREWRLAPHPQSSILNSKPGKERQTKKENMSQTIFFYMNRLQKIDFLFVYFSNRDSKFIQSFNYPFVFDSATLGTIPKHRTPQATTPHPIQQTPQTTQTPKLEPCTPVRTCGRSFSFFFFL